MSQQQPARPQEKPVDYGDIFRVAADGHEFIAITAGSVGGCIVEHNTDVMPKLLPTSSWEDDVKVTIGEALEASALSACNKPVEPSDAAAIQEAEMRATGTNQITPGGVSAMARSAVDRNAHALRDGDKIKLGDVLMDATGKLPADKVATVEDAEKVTFAEMRGDPMFRTQPGGVAASVAAAARMNRSARPSDFAHIEQQGSRYSAG